MTNSLSQTLSGTAGLWLPHLTNDTYKTWKNTRDLIVRFQVTLVSVEMKLAVKQLCLDRPVTDIGIRHEDYKLHTMNYIDRHWQRKSDKCAENSLNKVQSLLKITNHYNVKVGTKALSFLVYALDMTRSLLYLMNGEDILAPAVSGNFISVVTSSVALQGRRHKQSSPCPLHGCLI